MKIDRVIFQKTYNLGNYNSEKIGMEASIGENESPEEAIKILKELCDTIHRNNNPQLYKEQQEYEIPFMNKEEVFGQLENLTLTPNTLPKKLSQEELISSEILKCTTLKQLNEWEILSRKFEDTKKLFIEKKQQLLEKSPITN